MARGKRGANWGDQGRNGHGIDIYKKTIMYIPFRMSVEQAVIDEFGLPTFEDVADNFKLSADFSRMVKFPMDFMEIVSMYDNGIEVKFFNKKEIPAFYERLLAIVSNLKNRKHQLGFNDVLYGRVCDLGDHLLDTYTLRLRKHFYSDRDRKNEFFLDMDKFESFELNRIER